MDTQEDQSGTTTEVSELLQKCQHFPPSALQDLFLNILFLLFCLFLAAYTPVAGS